MNSNDTIRTILQNINHQKKYPALKLVNDNLNLAAIASKLITTKDKTTVDQTKEFKYNLNDGKVNAIANETMNRIQDNTNITQLFPDIELAVQILISSILSPKDMLKTSLLYTNSKAVMSSSITMKLNKIVATNLDEHYKLVEDLPKILRATLFTSGSYARVILPESIVDEIINGNAKVSLESMSDIFVDATTTKNLNILGSPLATRNVATELFNYSGNGVAYENRMTIDSGTGATVATSFNGTVEVTDNYQLLKLPLVMKAKNKEQLKHLTQTALESLDMTNEGLAKKLYKQQRPGYENVIVLSKPSQAKRKSVGRPLVMRIPSESIIPVSTPGDETRHIGYFVLVDINGNPQTVLSNQGDINAMNSGDVRNTQNKSLSSMLIQKAENNLASSNTVVTLDNISKIYSNIVESDLLTRLRTGIYGDNINIGNNDDVYRIMLARSLANKLTRLIFIPVELTSYYAFKYFPNGVGKSYLDDVKVLTSLRAILLFSKVMALTKNSIALTHVNMTLDPNDADPQKSIEIAIHEVSKVRQQYFPLGINSPSDLVAWVQRAGLEFSFEGHPGLPQVKFDTETKNMSHTVPDSDLDELLRKQTIMSFGLSPEVVDNGFNQEFATTVVANNVLFSKRVAQLQDILTPQITDDVKRIILNDPVIIAELIEVLGNNTKDLEASLSAEEKEVYAENPDEIIKKYVGRYIDTLMVELPKPDITSLKSQAEDYEDYKTALDSTLSAWISSDFITSDLAGELSGNIETIVAVLKNYYLRAWMANNNYMSELADITTLSDVGKPTIDVYEVNKVHIDALMRSSLAFIKSMSGIRADSDKIMSELNIDPNESEATDDSSSDTNDTSGEDDFGMDDMDMDVTEPAEDTGPETTEDDNENTKDTEAESDKTDQETVEPDKE